MSSESKPSRVLYENLDTSFVNLWALLRYLSQRSFQGRIHVELENYTADVFVNGSNSPLVHEIDRAARSDVTEEAALHRLVLRVRESPGSISVYEGEAEANAPESPESEATEIRDNDPEEAEEMTVATAVEPAPARAVRAATPESMRSIPAAEAKAEPAPDLEKTTEPATQAERNDAVRASGELIAAIEQAAISAGADFEGLFREARISLGDDYTFLDPMSGEFRYERSVAEVGDKLAMSDYVAGLSEALRHVVDRVAAGDRARRTRERVALELARVARKNNEALARSGFKAQLDRIAGTKVI